MNEQKKRTALELMLESVQVVAMREKVATGQGNIFEIWEVNITETNTELAVVIETAQAEIKEGEYKGTLETAVGFGIYFPNGNGGFNPVGKAWWKSVVYRKVLNSRHNSGYYKQVFIPFHEE